MTSSLRQGMGTANTDEVASQIVRPARWSLIQSPWGTITPEVVRHLDMDVASYPHRLLTFPRLRLHLGRVHVPVPCVQHSIRRFEFDAWLLERSGAPVVQHNVRHIRAEEGGYLIDHAFRCRYLIGAGRTRCPV